MANRPLARRGHWGDDVPPGPSWSHNPTLGKVDAGVDERVDSGLGSLTENSVSQILGDKSFLEPGVGQVGQSWAFGLGEVPFPSLREQLFDSFDREQGGIWQFNAGDTGQKEGPLESWTGQRSKRGDPGPEDSETCYSQVDRLDSALGESITEEMERSMREATAAEGSGLGGIQQGVEAMKISDAPVKCGIMPSEVSDVLGYLTEDGDTALQLAVIHEHEAFLDYLLSYVAGEDFLDVQNDLGQTALHIAVIMGQPQIVEKLVLAGASLCIQERSGNTALHIACKESFQECVDILLNPKGLRPRNQAQVTQQLDCVSFGGYTALHLAIQKNDFKSVQALVSAGANINKRELTCGRSPLHLAVESQNLEMVEWLLLHGADVNAKMCAGYTPLYSALFRSNEQIQACLRRFGAREPELDSDESDFEDSEDSDNEYDDIFFNGAVL